MTRIFGMKCGLSLRPRRGIGFRQERSETRYKHTQNGNRREKRFRMCHRAHRGARRSCRPCLGGGMEPRPTTPRVLLWRQVYPLMVLSIFHSIFVLLSACTFKSGSERQLCTHKRADNRTSKDGTIRGLGSKWQNPGCGVV